MIFIDNKYSQLYNSIVERAKSRSLPQDTYTETHHIIPRCFYKRGTKSKISPGWLDGNPDNPENLVILTAREHFICHLLLVKISPNSVAKSKMAFALTRFVYSSAHVGHITARKYEKINLLKSEATSLMNKGRKRTAPISNETRQKLSEAAKRRKGLTPEGRAKLIAANTGRKHSEETKQKLREARQQQVINQGGTMTIAAREKLSIAAKGRILSDIHKAKISLANQGKQRSEEVKQKLRERMKGYIKSESTLQKLKDNASRQPKEKVICPYCNKEGGKPAMLKWHFDKCKYK